MEKGWGLARAAAAKGFTKSPASMSVAGAADYTASFYRDRIFNVRRNLMNQNAIRQSDKF